MNLSAASAIPCTSRLAIGISEGLPKLVALTLMQPVLQSPQLRLLCDEGEFDDLFADVALHKFDAVLADRAAPQNHNLKLYSHTVGVSKLAWYAPASLFAAVKKVFHNRWQAPRCYCRQARSRYGRGWISGSSA